MKKLKVLFVTQEDPIYVAEFWETFVKYVPELKKRGIEITGIASLFTLGKKSKWQLFKQVYRLYGLWGTIKLGIRYLKNRDRKIKKYANLIGSSYFEVKNVNSKEFIRIAKESDIVFSVAASQIFRKELLNAPKYGCYNIHNGPLPKYRGMMPVFWQIYNGEKKIGITIHKMNEKLDAGEIVMQEFFSMENLKTVDEVMRYGKKVAADMVKRFLLSFDPNSENKFIYNDIAKGNYFSFPKRKHLLYIKKKYSLKMI